MTPQLTPLHDLRDEGGPIEASNPQIGLLGQNLLASWDDKRFIDANGWSQTQRTVRARYVAPDGGLGTESILTPLLPYGRVEQIMYTKSKMARWCIRCRQN